MGEIVTHAGKLFAELTFTCAAATKSVSFSVLKLVVLMALLHEKYKRKKTG